MRSLLEYSSISGGREEATFRCFFLYLFPFRYFTPFRMLSYPCRPHNRGNEWLFGFWIPLPSDNDYRPSLCLLPLSSSDALIILIKQLYTYHYTDNMINTTNRSLMNYVICTLCSSNEEWWSIWMKSSIYWISDKSLPSLWLRWKMEVMEEKR